MTFHLLFLGTNAINAERGLMTPNEDEARLKEPMTSKSQRVVLVADNPKIGKQSFLQFAEFEDLDTSYTGKGVGDTLAEVLNEADVETAGQ
jgi:DeoR family fructose operon transcriptional repressor